MITLVRTGIVHDGKLNQAFVWAIKVARYVTEVTGNSLTVHRNFGGTLYEVHWMSRHDSMAALETTVKKVEADPGYQKLVAEGREQQLFIGSSIVDRFYEAVG